MRADEILQVASHDDAIGLGFIDLGERDGKLRTQVKSERLESSVEPGQSRHGDRVCRSMHRVTSTAVLLDENAVDELDRFPFREDSKGQHLVELRGRQPAKRWGSARNDLADENRRHRSAR